MCWECSTLTRNYVLSVCVCVYTYICTYVYIYIYTYIYACVYTSTFCRTLLAKKRCAGVCGAYPQLAEGDNRCDLRVWHTHTPAHRHADRDRQRQTRIDTYVRDNIPLSCRQLTLPKMALCHNQQKAGQALLTLKKGGKRLQCASLASPCHAGRRTIFVRSQMQRFSLKQNSKFLERNPDES